MHDFDDGSTTVVATYSANQGGAPRLELEPWTARSAPAG